MTQTSTANAIRSIRIEIDIPASHPAFEGHFPGRPILPGVVLLDLVVDAIGRQMAQNGLAASDDLPPFTLRVARFHAMVPPDSRLVIEYEPRDPTAFTVYRGDERVASGTFDGLWIQPVAALQAATAGASRMP